jgi:hypothetical protein
MGPDVDLGKAILGTFIDMDTSRGMFALGLSASDRTRGVE